MIPNRKRYSLNSIKTKLDFDGLIVEILDELVFIDTKVSGYLKTTQNTHIAYEN